MRISENKKLKTVVILLNDKEIKNLSEGGYPVFDVKGLPFFYDKDHQYITLMMDTDKSGGMANPDGKTEEGNE